MDTFQTRIDAVNRHKWAHTFTVKGSGEFPFDMLRYDSCYPLREEDTGMMMQRDVTRYVNLGKSSAYQYDAVTVARWSSFGWTVMPAGFYGGIVTPTPTPIVICTCNLPHSSLVASYSMAHADDCPLHMTWGEYSGEVEKASDA